MPACFNVRMSHRNYTPSNRPSIGVLVTDVTGVNIILEKIMTSAQIFFFQNKVYFCIVLLKRKKNRI